MTKQISHGVKKIITGFGIAVLVLAGLVWMARPNPQNKTAASFPSGSDGQGMLAVEEANSYDFGAISMAAGTVAHRFKIKNTGSEAVVVNKMYTSCMCTTAALTAGGRRFGPYGMPGHGAIPNIGQTIDPNEEAIVDVVFDPAAHGPAGVGRIQRTVVIENDGGQAVELQFTATVRP